MLTNGGDEGDDELAAAAYFGMHVAQLGVFPDDPCILLMHADGLLDDVWLSCTVSHFCTVSLVSLWSDRPSLHFQFDLIVIGHICKKLCVDESHAHNLMWTPNFLYQIP